MFVLPDSVTHTSHQLSSQRGMSDTFRPGKMDRSRGVRDHCFLSDNPFIFASTTYYFLMKFILRSSACVVVYLIKILLLLIDWLIIIDNKKHDENETPEILPWDINRAESHAPLSVLISVEKSPRFVHLFVIFVSWHEWCFSLEKKENAGLFKFEINNGAAYSIVHPSCSLLSVPATPQY